MRAYTNDPTFPPEVDVFRQHWSTLKPLRDQLEHPIAAKFELERLWISDHIWVQDYGHEPEWDFTIAELHDPVKELSAAIDRTFPT